MYSAQNSNLSIAFAILCIRWKKHRNTFNDLWYRGCRSLTSRRWRKAVFMESRHFAMKAACTMMLLLTFTQVETCVNTEHISYEPADPLSRKTDKVLLYLHSYSLIILTIRSYVNIEELQLLLKNDTFSHLCRRSYVAKYNCTNYHRRNSLRKFLKNS